MAKEEILVAQRKMNSVSPGMMQNVTLVSKAISKAGTKAQECVDFEHMQQLKSESGEKLGCLSVYVNVNASTRHIHMERDCTHTLITAPQQKSQEHDFLFEFKINEKKSLFLKLDHGASFCFSTLCLSHRQIQSSGNCFFNISACGNKHLCCDARKSLNRRGLKQS